MARSYKRDTVGRFSGGGGGAISSGLQARKKAVSTQVSNDALSGKKVSPARKSYATAQNAEARRMAGSGKGNKAARRVAAAKANKPAAKASKPAAKASKPAANSSLMARIEASRAAGRAKGKAMAAKSSSRNSALDRKAKALGG